MVRRDPGSPSGGFGGNLDPDPLRTFATAAGDLKAGLGPAGIRILGPSDGAQMGLHFLAGEGI